MKSDNELIAEFMGVGFKGDKKVFPIAYKVWCSNINSYNTSWLHLHDVIEKIEELNLQNSDNIIGSQARYILLEKSIACELSEIYKAVVEFIKWYNLQPK
jgi:hypothetical protein